MILFYKNKENNNYSSSLGSQPWRYLDWNDMTHLKNNGIKFHDFKEGDFMFFDNKYYMIENIRIFNKNFIDKDGNTQQAGQVAHFTVCEVSKSFRKKALKNKKK